MSNGEHATGQRLAPSLLDRLRDDHPQDRSVEPRRERAFSQRELKAMVVRDLESLLNTVALSAIQDLGGLPAVSKSVINYGLPDLTGTTASGVDKSLLERAIRQAIIDFEPRINRSSLIVNVVIDESEMTHNAIGLEIEGMIWGQPSPQQLYVKTDIDLETGTVPLSAREGLI